MNPFIPHFTNECLGSLDLEEFDWPTVSKREILEEEINFVVQINGKKRAILKVKRDISEDETLKVINTNDETNKFLKDKKIQKIIFVLNRLINIIIK